MEITLDKFKEVSNVIANVEQWLELGGDNRKWAIEAIKTLEAVGFVRNRDKERLFERTAILDYNATLVHEIKGKTFYLGSKHQISFTVQISQLPDMTFTMSSSENNPFPRA